MANLTKSLKIGNSSYEFVGKHWYGVCSTLSTTQNKTVSITGFTSADLVEGVQVTVRFAYTQEYNGLPTLNVSSTGAKQIYYGSWYNAGVGEWAGGDIITFAYFNNHWFIVDGEHAGTNIYGKTKLSNTIANDGTVALTPKAVYDAGYVNASGAAAAAPVQSVNGQTGAVSLTIPTVPTNVSDFNNDAGYITGINSSDVTTALGYTPYNGATNPNGYLTSSTGVTQYSGLCTTAASTQAKEVDIWGFNSSKLVGGVIVFVRFMNKQDYDGQPTLNVSSTGAYPIAQGFSTGALAAGKGEWGASVELMFQFVSQHWVIIGGRSATTSNKGLVQLSSTIANDDTTALTPKAVNDANYQTTGNLVTSVSSASTDAQYPSAKLFYDTVGDIETLLASI